ncbi:Acetylcholine receptor subunit alpha-type acr-16 [Frankliniella fusca]|uniref:Acetylcholine receptor subunit alpha-type acr-16 n=1 Tax=Frankliniella fusca TaxID=407009 RepID=A0AAE1LBA5_9NEOP|nr:Acetylcholine receptor subunit alpha-type acr-16 [Frankliniella fusca]
MHVSQNYNFQQKFSIEDEVVTVGSSKAVRFLVKGPKDVHIRLQGASPSSEYYEIDINFVSKIAIQRGSEYMDITTCTNCLSASEFRLFTILYNATTISLFEGAALTGRPQVAAQVANAFNVASVSFSSMGSAGPVHWLHACQGEPAALPASSTPTSAEKEVQRPAPGALRPVKPDAAELRGCRVVNTFKYRFDGFFAISEEGYVSGSRSVLPFRVMGRKDIHLQLVSAIPPGSESTYEIDIDFHNHTNLDRGIESKVASTQHAPLLSPTELRGFVLEHDMATGQINLTAVDAGGTGGAARNLLLWRDPKPFALRYFSVSSGSSAGNDTTWAFGCPGLHRDHAVRDEARLQSGCSAPLHTYAYSHSQYLSVEREGVIEGPRRTLHLYLRALGSGHIRLEAQLPPAVDALLEVDLSHMGNTSIDYLGKRVASVRLGALLTLRESRGFWVRQDTGARTLEVGKEGSVQPLLSWTAPVGNAFPPIRFFSLATSRSVGNGTWIYGCKDGKAPTEYPDEDTAVPESTESNESTDVEIGESESLSVPASKRLSTHVGLLGSRPPASGTAIAVRLKLRRVTFNDVAGAAEVRGTLQSTWREADLAWEPRDYENIQDVTNLEPGWLWTPKYTVTNGDLALDGLLHVRHTGKVRWEGALHAQAQCTLHARSWPRDRHSCLIEIGLEAATRLRLQLLADTGAVQRHLAVDVDPRAAHPLWRLEGPVTATVVNDSMFAPFIELEHEAQAYLLISLTLSRASPVMHHLLLAPFVVLAMLCLLAYWVREPLPRDKVLLGALALLLVVFSFLVLEAACPPALVGMPVIVELYCWCMVTVALAVTVSCVMTALARDVPVRRPPALLCRLVSASCVRLLLQLSSDQAERRGAEYELRPDSVDYVKRSTQVYLRFDQGKASDCTCNNKGCSKQSTVEAQYYWSLLALACERLLSIACFILLLTALVVVKL